ncbi:MAG: PEP-CTERM sorting domain-containing protein [Steroidobacteraceae bacterium]
MNKTLAAAVIAASALVGFNANATIIDPCPTSGERVATSTNTDSCVAEAGVTGTPNAGDVLALFPGDPWTNEGGLDKNGTDGFLTVALTSGSWGGQNVAGTWTIGSGFWDLYGEAVLSMHVGNGNGDPDWWFFEITPNQSFGTFTYVNTGAGGGLSNLFLWGRDEGGGGGGGGETPVPEPTSLALLGLGLAGLGAARRRKA